MGKIVIAELDLDNTALLKAAAENKNKIEELKASLDGLKGKNGEITDAYVKQEAQIKSLSTQYTSQKNVIAALTTADGAYIKVEQQITDLLGKEIVSIDEARKNNSDLLKIRNQLNLATDEGVKAAEAINDKLDANNGFIKENVSQYEKQKINIGNYTESIKEAIGANSEFGNTFTTLQKATEVFSGTFGLLKNEFQDGANQIKNAAAETKGLTVAQQATTIATNATSGAMKILKLAIAATGIGLLIIAAALLFQGLSKFTPLMDKLEQVFAGVGAAVEVVEKTLVSFVTGITSVGDAINKLGSFLEHPIDSFKKLGTEMANAAEAAAQLKKEQQDLADQMDIQEVQNAKANQQYAQLILQSKNRSLSEKERIDLLKQAEKVDQDNYDQRAALAAKDEELAIRKIALVKGVTAEDIEALKTRGVAAAKEIQDRIGLEDDLITKLKESELASIAIQDESTKRQEKIQNAQDALREKEDAAREKAQQKAIELAKKAAEAEQKRLEDIAKISKANLDLFISEQGIRAKSLEDELKQAETIRDKKLQIAQDEFTAAKNAAKDKEGIQAAEIELRTKQNEIKNEFAKAQVEQSQAFAEQELNNIKEQNQKILDQDKFLSQALYEQKKAAIEQNATAEAEAFAQKLSDGVINEQTYNDEINRINTENQTTLDALAEERKAADLDKQLTDLENERAGKQLTFDEDLATRLQQLEIQKQQELTAANKSGADKELIIKKYAKAESDISKSTEQSKLDNTQNFLSAAQGLFKENTTAYKAIGVAEATINTYKAATAAYAAGTSVGGPAALATGALYAGVAIAAGLAQVAKIVGVKFEKGGIATKSGSIQRIKGKSHTAGGEPVYIGGQYVGEAQGDEGVGILNRGAFSAFMDFNNKFSDGAKSSPTFMAGGGIISQTVQRETIDLDGFADVIIETVKSIRPVVAVEEILTVADQYTEVVSGADH